MRFSLKISLIILVIICGVYYFSLTPKSVSNWSLDQQILPTAEIDSDTIKINNIRNFTYRSTTDYTPHYYDTKVKLTDLTSVDFIVEPFGSIGAAHTFLSFGFKDGKQIAISIEIRKEVGESFSPVLGVLRQYELVYVIADERDVIGLRVNHRKDDVYLYPTTASPEKAQALFLSMLTRANQVASEPEFYNTLTNNCTTNIADHIEEISDTKIGLDYRLVFPESSDVLAKELGFISPEMTIEEARTKYRVNEKVEKYKDSEDFSKLIRS